MNKKLGYLLVIILFFGCGHIKPQVNAGFETDATRRKKLDRYFTALAEMQKFNGVVLVQDNNSKTYLKPHNLIYIPSNGMIYETPHQAIKMTTKECNNMIILFE